MSYDTSVKIDVLPEQQEDLLLGSDNTDYFKGYGSFICYVCVRVFKIMIKQVVDNQIDKTGVRQGNK